MRWLLCCGLILFLLVSNSASDTVDSTRTEPTDTSITADTVVFVPPESSVRTEEITDTTDYEKRLTQNPTVALFKSVLVPGLGQIGNHRYVKAAAIIGLEFWFASSAVHYGSRASDLRRQWEAETDTSRRLELYDQFQHYRDQRNKYTWFTGITIFISMFDAYVDAHLSGAPDQQKHRDLDLAVVPDGAGGVQAAVRLSF